VEDNYEPEYHYSCNECQSAVKGHQRFCHHCGAYLGAEAHQEDIFNNDQLRSAFVFYSIYLLICLVVRYTGWFESYDEMFWIELVLAAITILFVYYRKAAILPLLSVKSLRLPVVAVLIVLAAAFSWLISTTVRELNVSLFNADTSYYDGYKIYILPRLVMVYSIALMPALFEELAFRGILYNYLSAFLNDRLVVLVTAFMFAAMHLNFISLIWLIPFGIFLGFLRRKYDTIWYGVIFHFIFNLTACLLDLYRDGHLF
jgi:membrane protease YdiL (CAAX protease family)